MTQSAVALAVHGGAGPISEEAYKRTRPVMRELMEKVTPALMEGASALDVVEQAVRFLEGHPGFNAGLGASLRYDGSIELDASIMDGSTVKGAGVAAVKGIVHPVTLARYVLERTPHVLLAGEGAMRFAQECGMQLVPDEDLMVPERRELWERKKAAGETPADQVFSSGGPVGAVALDRDGRLAAATSTGGLVLSMPGRVGDSAILGAGTYADEICAVSCTGVGESIMLIMQAKTCADCIASGMIPQDAAKHVVKLQAERVPGTSGVVAVNAHGQLGVAWNSRNMYRSYFTPDAGMVVPE